MSWQRAAKAPRRTRSIGLRPGKVSSSRGEDIDVELALLVEADARRAEAELVLADADLGRQRPHAVVGGQDHVVVAVDRDPAEVGGAGQAAELAIALVDRDGDAGLGQAVSGAEAEQAAADDADAGARHAFARIRVATWRAIRRV